MTTYTGSQWADNDITKPLSAARVSKIDRAAEVASNWGELLTALPGDGTTDVTTIVQAAINAASTTAMNGMKFQNSSGVFQGGLTAPGGGVVVLPPGVHVVSNLLLGHRVTLKGAGHGTVLFQKANSTGPVIANRYDGSVHAQYCGIENLTVHGNKANQTVANVGIKFTGNTSNNYNDPLDEDYDVNCWAHNVYVMQTKGDGIQLTGAGANRISDCKVRGADGVGILVFQDNHISGCDIGWSGYAGIQVDGESCTITNTKCWYSGRVNAAAGHGFYMTADSGAMAGCNAQDNKAAGFCWDNAHGWSATGLLSDSNSFGTSGTAGYPAFDMFDSDYNQVFGTARNRYNAGFNGTTSVGEMQNTFNCTSGSLGNTMNLTAAVGVWGMSNTFKKSGAVIPAGNTIVVNGVTQS